MTIEYLYPLAQPVASHRIEVDSPHVLHVQEYGSPEGIPVVFLHGGPGAGSKPEQIRSFDPARYRIVLLDQRGCGRSSPSGELDGNDTAALIRDLETIRTTLGIERWVVAGGSWGSLLTLSYAIAHPDRCLALRVHGIFLGRPQEVRFWFHDVAAIFPDAHAALAGHVDADERDDLLAAYYSRLTSDDADTRLGAAKALRGFSARTQTLVPNAAHINGLTADKPALEIARIFTHYCTNGFFQSDNHVLDNIEVLRRIPCEIIQGRYDTVTPMMSAQALREAWPEARFTLVDLANHVATREAPAMTEALRCAADRIADRLGDGPARDAPDIDAYLALRAHHAPALSDDGAQLAWISDESGLDQLWTAGAADPDAGRSMPAPQDEKVGAVAFRPGSRDILFTTDRGGDERHQLHLLDAASGTVRALTQAPGTVHVWGCFSPDGARIAYACNPDTATDMEIRVMDLASGEAQTVLTGPGWRWPRRFTPDGTGLLIEDNRDGMYNASLHLLDIDSGDCREVLAADGATQIKAAHWINGGAGLLLATDRDAQFTGIATLDLSDGTLNWIAQPEGDVEQLALTSDKTGMVYAVNREGYSTLHTGKLDGSDLREIALPFACRVTGIAMDPDGASAVLALAGFRAPSTLWRVPLTGGGAAQCIAESSVTLAKADTVAPDTVSVPSFDGAEVPAFVFEPESPAPASGRPVIVFVHGGPESQYAAHWRADMQYFARRGWLAVAPNVRGSTGYGRAWQAADDHDKRMDAVRDLKALRDWLAARQDVDASRIAVTGQSYGGFMVLAALTEYPEDWRVAAEFYGIADFNTLMATTGPWRRKLRAVEYGDPDTAKGRALLARISPFAKIAQISTPLFIAHGGDDPRVTPVESELVYSALRGRGHDVQLLRIDHEGHGFARAANRVAAYGAMCRFIESRARSTVTGQTASSRRAPLG